MSDHRPDLYDRIEIEAPHDVELPTWVTFEWMPCQDCRANAFFRWRGAPVHEWDLTIAHDDGCPTLAAIEGGS